MAYTDSGYTSAPGSVYPSRSEADAEKPKHSKQGYHGISDSSAVGNELFPLPLYYGWEDVPYEREYVFLESTPYTATAPDFQHGPVRIEKEGYCPKLGADDGLDWTAFQMTILDSANIYYTDGEDTLRRRREAEEVEAICEWWDTLGFDGPGNLLMPMDNECDDQSHEEDEPMCFWKLPNAMSLDEKMNMWGGNHDKDHAVADPSDYFEGVEDEVDILGYTKTVNSDGGERLIHSLSKEASRSGDFQQPATIGRIRQQILSQPLSIVKGGRQPTFRHTISIQVPERCLQLLLGEGNARPRSDSQESVADRIVATCSSAHTLQLSTVKEYIHQTWPSASGIGFLGALQKAINGTTGVKASVTLTDNVEIGIGPQGRFSEVYLTGPSCSIAEYGEQLAWLVAVLQPTVPHLPVAVTPFLRSVHNFSLAQANTHGWVIETLSGVIDGTDLTAYSPWQGEGSIPTVVRGFPTAARPEGCPGIEVPPDMFETLFRGLICKKMDERILFQGTEMVLELYKQTEDVSVWHILSSIHESCTCSHRFSDDAHDHAPRHLGPAEISRYRHIIGDCVTTREYYGEVKPEYEAWNEKTSATTMSMCARPSKPEHSLPGASGLTSNSGGTSEFLDSDMFSISDSSEDLSSRSSLNIDDGFLPVIDKVATHVLSEYRAYIKQLNSANESPSDANESGPGQQRPPTNHGSSQSTPGPNATRSGMPHSSRKRPAGQDDGSDDEDGSQRRPGPKRPKNDDGGQQPQRLFACPFWKHDPGRHRACFGKRLDRICRVKQHLVRSHMPAFYCDRCLAVFPSPERKRAHLRDERATCVFDDAARLDGITSEQRTELSRKPRGHGRAGGGGGGGGPPPDARSQWFAVWAVVFPDLPPPASPYVDDHGLSEDLCHFRAFAEARGPAALRAELRAHGLRLAGPGLDEEAEGEVFHAVMRRTMRAVFDGWLADRAASLASSASASSALSLSPRNSTSEGSSSPDEGGSGGERRGGGGGGGRQERRSVWSSGAPSSLADSGVELVPSPSHGDANLLSYTPIRPRPSSEGRPDWYLSGVENLSRHAPGVPNIGHNPTQVLGNPSVIDAASYDPLVRGSGPSFDTGSLGFGFDQELTNTFDLTFDMDQYLQGVGGCGNEYS